MSNIDKRALREAAEKATPGNWWIDSHGQAMVSFIENDVLEVFATDNKRAAVRHEDTGNLSRWRNDNDATFIATADPATVLALLDELEARDIRIVEQSDYFSALVAMARKSADKAMRKFPQPNYVLLKVAEEAGEVVQAGVHYAENRMTWEEVEGEIVQLLAMLIRLVTEGDQVNGITPPQSVCAAAGTAKGE